MNKLVIVESPNKIKSIKKYLGENYEVDASVWHIVYLPSSGQHRFGFEVDVWEPNYKIDPKKKEVVSKLKELSKKADEVLIATDPDREGEAIADNLVEFLNIGKKYKRIRFNEITEEAVKLAVNSPSIVDSQLVKSQIARRILDRMIGYKLSGLMKQKIKNSITVPSAGRVQSVALKIVVERENEIDAFIPIEYKTIEAIVGEDINAQFISGNFHDNKEWIDPKEIESIKPSLKGSLKVSKVSTTQRKDKKLKPLEMATLYKRAESAFGLSSSKTRQAAQRLYEGFGEGGLISYPRTDSTRLSNLFVDKAQKYIIEKFGQNYVASEIKGSAGAQDAHEAIRPTNLGMTPDKASAVFRLSPAETKVYKLIYEHTLQCLMKVPIREILRYDLVENEYNFKLSSSKVIFDGYLKLTGYNNSKELPKYQEGEIIPVMDYKIEDKQTSPPPRYNEGSLIEALKNNGVGRPSTYDSTMSTLKNREYVEMLGRAFKPTDFGKVVLEKLMLSFPKIINEEYTAKMESDLDKVAIGERDYKLLLTNFWSSFESELNTATQELNITSLSNIPAGKDCPVCGNPLIVRKNKRDGSKFFACPTFPNCTHTESDPNSKRKFFRKWSKK